MAETKTTKTTKTATAAKSAKAAAPKATAKKATSTKTAAPKAPVADKQPVEVAKVVEKAPAKKAAAKQIKVTYTKSAIGYNNKQAKIIASLGLKKLHSSNVLPDNECVRGSLRKVAHLVTVEELN